MDTSKTLAHLETIIVNATAARAELLAADPPPPSFVPPVAPGASGPVAAATILLPMDNSAAMTKFYGAPSASPAFLGWFSFPHPSTRLYSRTGSLLKDSQGDSRLDHRTHKLLARRLTNALAEIYTTLGREQFEKEGWQVYGGSHNYRPTTSGGRLSTHSWAAAVDMNPNENTFNQTTTTFSDPAIDIMEAWGFLSGGRAWGKDWMHFQASIPSISSGSYYARNGLPKNIVAAA
jgi:hypothetical protein